MRASGWILVLCTMLMACHKTQPQRPTVRGEEAVDSTVVQLLTMSQQMAAKADMQLTQVADSDYVLMEENYWVKGLYPQDTHLNTLQQGEYVDIEAKFFSLKDQLLTTHQATARIGQIDEIQAIALILPHVQHGMQITMLVPWYLAFGSAGNGEVPPYENVRIELSVK